MTNTIRRGTKTLDTEPPDLLLIDIGNTHSHLAIANRKRLIQTIDLPTAHVIQGAATAAIRRFAGSRRWLGAALCSVVPRATGPLKELLKTEYQLSAVQLSPKTLRGVGIDYPRPATIGQDRLANAVAARHYFGAPVVVVDFGTAVTFDVVNTKGDYAGGIIAPGLAAMTDYLHEKTALLPRVVIREPRCVVGKSTEEAMLIGAVHGYRGLIRELIGKLRSELGAPRLPVVATGGYASLLSRGMPEITAVRRSLTLEGLRLFWEAHQSVD